MKTPLLVLFFFTFYTGYSQVVIDVDKVDRLAYRSVFNSSFPITNAKYVRLVSGSPFFSETWMKADVLAHDSSVYKISKLRLDLLEGIIIYRNDKNEEMTSDQSFKAISLTDTISGKNYVFVHSSFIAGTDPKEKNWYELLIGKNITLFKQYHKRMVESKAYASSVTEQNIETEERFFIALNGMFTRVKTASDIAKLVVTNKKVFQDYIEKNKLKGKTEAELITAVEYYDSLK